MTGLEKFLLGYTAIMVTLVWVVVWVWVVMARGFRQR